MRLTYPTTLVLQALLQGHHHGFDIMDATGAAERHRLPHPAPARRRRAVSARTGKRTARPAGAAPAAPLLRAHRRTAAASRADAVGALSRAPGRRAAAPARRGSAMSSPTDIALRSRHRPRRRPAGAGRPARRLAREWDAELAVARATSRVRYRRPIRRALGAFADAFWLRQRSVADFDWIDDVRHGVRQLVQHGGFAVTAIGILALGLAATVTMFSVTDQILLRPLPYPDADRIVTVWETRAPDDEPLEVSPGQSARLARARAVVRVPRRRRSVVARRRRQSASRGVVRRQGHARASSRRFGVTPLARPLLHARGIPEGPRPGPGHRRSVLAPALRRRSGRSSARSITTDDGPFTIVGIVPASFEPRLLPTGSGYRDVWQPKAIEDYEPKIRGSGYWAVGRAAEAGRHARDRAGRDDDDRAAARARVSAHQREDRRARAAAARSPRRQRAAGRAAARRRRRRSSC